MDTNGVKPKSFWSRPEGTTGMIALAALAVGGFFLVSAILPTLIAFLGMAITAVGQLIVLGVLGVLAAGFLYLVMNEQVHILVKNLFKNVMRKITGAFIEIDPIGIMKNYIDDLNKKYAVMVENITVLRQKNTQLQQQIDANKKEYADAEQKYRYASSNPNNVEGADLVKHKAANTMQRMTDTNKTLQALLDKMTILYKALTKYKEATQFSIEDLKEEVRTKSIEREQIIAASGAMRGAMSILRGSGAAKDMFDQALEFTVADFGARIGEIDEFMDTTKDIISTMDLNQGVADEKAMARLAEWERSADSLVLGKSSKAQISENVAPLTPINLNLSATPADDGFNKFFTKP